MPPHPRPRPDPETLLGADALGDALARLLRAAESRKVVVGWATVELDRGERELEAALAAKGLADPVVATAAEDEGLGARTRLLRYPDGREMLVLEPSTEGLLAAALARHGEGSVALYLLADAGAAERARAVGFRLASERPGPLGPQRVVLVGPRWGPFLVLVSDGGAAPPRS